VCGMGWGRVRAAAAVLLACAALAGCGADPVTTQLPAFPVEAATGGPAGTTAPTDGAVPDDCERILPVADLNALLGLPLDSVAVRTTLGVAEPSVSRTERVQCRYSGVGAAQSRTLLDVTGAAYADADAAAAQWRRNADAEDGEKRELALGTARAVVVERARETLLSVASAATTVTMRMPDQPLPAGRSRADVLVDLALRVLAVLPGPDEAPPEPHEPVRVAGRP
jgi:hypothetical protein